MKGDNIAERLIDLAVACLRLATELEDNAVGAVGKHIARQLIRCSTSGGANYEEARSAESSADFVHKVAVAAKEVGETVYWLKVAGRAGLSQRDELAGWAEEGRELVRILAASVRTARGKAVTMDVVAGEIQQ